MLNTIKLMSTAVFYNMEDNYYVFSSENTTERPKRVVPSQHPKVVRRLNKKVLFTEICTETKTCTN